jgi:hypothetical protein
MHRRVVIGAVVAFCVAAAILFIPWFVKDRTVIASVTTPRALYGVTPLTVGPKQTACVDLVSYDSQSQIARFGVQTHGRPGPPLELIAGGPGYRSVSPLAGGYSDSNDIEAAIHPPAHSVDGKFCWRNVGRVPVDLDGTIEPRTFSRSNTTLDGNKAEPDLQLAFLERKEQPLAARLGEIARHAGVFVPGGAAVVWIIALLALVGIPAGSFLALRSALDED